MDKENGVRRISGVAAGDRILDEMTSNENINDLSIRYFISQRIEMCLENFDFEAIPQLAL